MIYISRLLLVISSAIAVNNVNVEIDGVIDLGPIWRSLQFVNFSKSDPIYFHAKDSSEEEKDETDTTVTTEITTVTEKKKIHPENIYERARKVKEDKKINEFALHVYKQSMKVFEHIKDKLDPAVKNEMNIFARAFEEKLNDFMNETLNQKIKTRLGKQKVIINTIDTSNRLLNRMINSLLVDNGNAVSRNKMTASRTLLNEVAKEYALENKHICTKFGICRTKNGFDSFIIDLLTTLLESNDNSKITQASNAITEVLKTANHTKTMSSYVESIFKFKIGKAEKWEPKFTRDAFIVLRNLIAKRNEPLQVTSRDEDNVNKTVAFFELINDLEQVLPPNEENLLDWRDIKISFSEWMRGGRKDILEIIEALFNHVVTKGIARMDATQIKSTKRNFKVMFT